MAATNAARVLSLVETRQKFNVLPDNDASCRLACHMYIRIKISGFRHFKCFCHMVSSSLRLDASGRYFAHKFDIKFRRRFLIWNWITLGEHCDAIREFYGDRSGKHRAGKTSGCSFFIVCLFLPLSQIKKLFLSSCVTNNMSKATLYGSTNKNVGIGVFYFSFLLLAMFF